MEPAENKRFVYEFGKFVLDPREKTLFAEGRAIRLPAKEFETLLLLVENHGQALSKEEMMQAIWQDAVVEEVNLAKQISRLRKILDAGEEPLIETLPKHGYRFSADVNQVFQPAGKAVLEKRLVKRLTVRVEEDSNDSPPALPPERKRYWSAAGFAGIVLIVVLIAGLVWSWQRQKTTAAPEQGGMVWLTDGLHDDAGAYWTNQGQIFFSRYITATRIETWQMNADGSNQRRANSGIKDLLQGRFSPDADKVVFRREGSDKTVYLADADGGGEIALPFSAGNMDWSPDGEQFVYQAKTATGNSEIFLYVLKTRKSVNLTNNQAFDADPAFSPDGQRIAFVSTRDGNAEIYFMNADGSNVRRLTNHPAYDQFPAFAPDGTAIAFQSNREDERVEIYLQNLNLDAPPIRLTNSESYAGISPRCWSADGTQMLVYSQLNGKDRILLAKVEPFPARLVLADENADLSNPRLSPDGGRMLYEARLTDRRRELRLIDLASRQTATIFKTEANYPVNYYLAPAWSPDGRRIAFNGKSGGNSEIFIINKDGSGLRNLTNDPLPDNHATFSPDGSEIIFARDFYGQTYLYRMDPEGGSQRRLTAKDGYELAPVFSPNGASLAFAADRVNTDSRGLDIYLLDFRDPGSEKRLTARPFHEFGATFSPDGSRIAFIATGDGNPEIYLMNADGTGLIRLTRTKAEEAAPQFSHDGKTLFFARNENGRFALFEIELLGG